MEGHLVIQIVCSEHPGKRAIVATMTRSRDGRWRDWGGPPTDAQGVRQSHDRSATTSLVGDRVARDDVNAETGWEEPERETHTFVCPRCGLNRAARGERLDPQLDAVEAAGREEIPLRLLT